MSKISYLNSASKSILVLSISQHLTGKHISRAIVEDWSKPKAAKISDLFENIGFDLKLGDIPAMLKELKRKLEMRAWDGILVGWCIRGHVEFTVVFEEVVAVCVDAMQDAPKMKLMFSTGPDNLVETVVRNFPVHGS